ncbi:MAG TPA: DUF6326 family protein [Gemmatimonadales bacterium]|nr:DUF6326 family protein [Gemmatimonadales bacterium]
MRSATRPAAARQYRETHVDVKLVLSALWVTMLFVFAYVDIFGFYRADVLKAALDGQVATTGFTVNQTFLAYSLVYILLPAVMVVLSLLLRPRVNRIVNITVSLVYVVTIIGSAIGETWAYYLIGSAIEVLVLAAIARAAWTWATSEVALHRPGLSPSAPRRARSPQDHRVDDVVGGTAPSRRDGEPLVSRRLLALQLTVPCHWSPR